MRLESAKLRALCVDVPTNLAYLRVHVPTFLACLRVHMPTCHVCLCAHLSTSLECLRAYVSTCLRAHVPASLACFVLTCEDAILNKVNSCTIQEGI